MLVLKLQVTILLDFLQKCANVSEFIEKHDYSFPRKHIHIIVFIAYLYMYITYDTSIKLY